MTNVTYDVPAISCDHCVHTIQMEVGDLAGVASVKAHEDSKKVEISFGAPATEEQIVALMKEINYPPAGK